MSMFCYQCEQTAKSTACEKAGICGKDPTVAALQDVIVYQVKGIGWLAYQAGQAGHYDKRVDQFVLEALFTTVTNVDFDPERLLAVIRKAEEIRKLAAEMIDANNGNGWPVQAKYTPAATIKEIVEQAQRTAIENALHQTGGNVAEAAKLLDVNKGNLYRLMDKLGMIRRQNKNDS